MKQLLVQKNSSCVQIFSPAKINLYLKILKKNQDGYHDLVTLFERIAVFDRIVMEKSQAKSVNITGSGPKGKDNIIYKALNLLRGEFNIKQGVNVCLEKNIPIGAGLGGGSSNAAFAMLGFLKLYNIKIPKRQLFSIGEKLGADVCFFLLNQRFALGKSKGEVLARWAVDRELYHVIVYPNTRISTAKVYAGWDLTKSFLTDHRVNVRILKQYLAWKQIRSLKKIIHNDLTPAAFKYCPRLGKIQKKLERLSTESFFLSGSGSSFFSVHSTKRQAREVFENLKKKTNYNIFITESL